MQRVRIVSEDDKIPNTHCYINDTELHGVVSASYSQDTTSIPIFTFETVGLPDIDMIGDVHFRFTPDTVQQAAIVLQNEFANNPESHKALVASVASALKELPEETWLYDAAERIAKRIMGIELQKKYKKYAKYEL